MNPRRLTQIARTLRKNDTWAEKLLWTILRDRRFSEYKFRRQHIFGEHILDFFCLEARLNIELDGSGHGHPERQARDTVRDAELEAKAMEVATNLATGPQHAIRFTKRALNQWLLQAGPIFDHSLVLEMLGFFSEDVKAGIEGVREKRKPDFPSARDKTEN